MEGFEGLGRSLIILGVILLVIGLLLVFGVQLPHLGRLPGDIVIKKEGFTFYFPIVTMLVASLLLTLVINIILRLMGK